MGRYVKQWPRQRTMGEGMPTRSDREVGGQTALSWGLACPRTHGHIPPEVV